jgi:mannose-1-phosphate guanylyltransferase
MTRRRLSITKAFLLAAGIGSRLRPLTYSLPKCLVPINGKPLLSYWLSALDASCVTHALVNTHWLAPQVVSFLNSFSPTVDRLLISSTYEPVLLGSAGTIAANYQWAISADTILVVYADNYTDLDLSSLLESHISSGRDLTIATFETSTPCSCGIIEVDSNDNVISFQEKPRFPRGNLASAGIYAFNRTILDQIVRLDCRSAPFDFGIHVLPYIFADANVYRITGVFHDIGTPASYAQVNALFH